MRQFRHFFQKFKELIMTSSVRTRLQAKYSALMKALGKRDDYTLFCNPLSVSSDQGWKK
jgi:hypothetical protein